MNIKKILINYSAIAVCVVCYVLFTKQIHAQQVHFSLDPPIVQAKIKPGKTIIIAYTVQNSGDPTNLQFLVRPFTPAGQLGSLSLIPQMEGPVQFNLENAEIVMEKPFFFPSREKRQAILRIHVPPGIPDGDYYYLVLAETVPAFSLGGESAGVASASIGSPLLITITDSGTTEIKATIAEFSFKPDYSFTIGNNIVSVVDNAKELPIVCSVRNMGKNLIQPQGTIIDQNGDSKNTYDIISQNILSNSQRIIKTFASEDTTQKDATLVLSHLSVGSHRVTAQLSFGENTSIQYKTLSFLALPVRLISVALGALIIVLVFFLARFMQRKKK